MLGLSRIRRSINRDSLTNIGALAAIQISNAITPLIIFPIVLAIVGHENFVHIVVAEAIALMILSLVLYSFEIDGVAASIGLGEKSDSGKLSLILSEIIILRIFLYVVGLSIAQIFLIFYPSLALLVLGWSFVSLASAVQPNWLFQALEKNFTFSSIIIVSRIGALVTIILLVNSEDNYKLVPFCIGLWYFAGGICALIYAKARFGLRFVRPQMARLKYLLWSGKEIFLGNISTAFYRDSNVLFLGLLGVSSSSIASYSLAEKLTKIIQAAMRPFNQFFFPRALAVAKTAEIPNLQSLKGITRLIIPQEVLVFTFIVSGIFAYFVVLPLFPALRQVYDVDLIFFLTLIMATSSIAGVAVFMLGVAGLNVLGARPFLLWALIAGVITNAVINLIFIPVIGVYGSALAFVLSECIVLIVVVWRYMRRG